MTRKEKKKSAEKALPLFVPSFRIEVDGRGKYMRVLMSGVVGICELSDESIKLLTRYESLKIIGRRLSVSVFEGNTVEISGEVESIGKGSVKNAKG